MTASARPPAPIFPPRPVSPYGSHRALEWAEISSSATIWSYVIPHPLLLPDFAESTAKIEIGARVRVVSDKLEPRWILPPSVLA